MKKIDCNKVHVDWGKASQLAGILVHTAKFVDSQEFPPSLLAGLIRT